MKRTPAAEGASGLVLVADDDPDLRALLDRWLTRAGFRVETFSSGEACLAALGRVIPDAICLDLHMPGASGIETLQLIHERLPLLPVLILTGDREVSRAVEAMRQGAWNYLNKPPRREALITTVRLAVEQHRLKERLSQLEREAAGGGYPGIIGRSEAMMELFRHIDRAAPTDISVLLHGESGTGKELVARALHDNSGRRKGPFVAVNCGAIAESLQESELFGHERGAFTGAAARRAGRVEQADTGTLFLDEVAELSPSLQAALLRVLQERTFRRLGGNRDLRSDFRLIAASHRDLLREVEAGRFRQDLYFRLAVFELDLPPLREREGDILLLAGSLMEQQADELGLDVPTLAPDAVDLLTRHRWPGNVRELQNVLKRALVVAREGRIGAADLPRRLRQEVKRAQATQAEAPPATTPTAAAPTTAPATSIPPVSALAPSIPAAPLPPLSLPADVSLASTASTSTSGSVSAPPTSTPSTSATGAVPAPSDQEPPLPAPDPWMRDGRALTLVELERGAIEAALERTGGNVQLAAQQLGIGRTTIYRKLKDYGLR